MRQFKVGDKVTVVADEALLGRCCLPGSLIGKQGVVAEIGCDDYHSSPYSYLVDLDPLPVAFLPELGLELTGETSS